MQTFSVKRSGGPDSITKQQVRNIYLNRSSQMPDGQRAVAFELAPGTVCGMSSTN